MDSSEGDFALLLLAEKQPAISKKKPWRTNKRTSKHTNVTQIIVYEKLFPLFYDHHSIDQSLDRSVKIQLIDRSQSINHSIDRSKE